MEIKKIKETIGRKFQWTLNFKFLKVVENIIDRVDLENEDVESEVWVATSDELIYEEDRWEVMKFYFQGDIEDANWLDAWAYLEEDIIQIVEELRK